MIYCGCCIIIHERIKMTHWFCLSGSSYFELAGVRVEVLNV